MPAKTPADRRILLLTYAFPPTAVPEAYSCAKRYGGLRNVTVDVLTVPPFRNWMGNDTSLEPYIASRFGRITRADVPPKMRYLPLGRLGPLSNRPDALRLMNRKMMRGAATLKLNDYSAIVTSSQWHSIHLVGLTLKRLTNLPWLAHLSDPWLDNPYVRWSERTRRANARLEKSVFVAADLVTVTNGYAKAAVVSRHPDLPDDRVAVLSHAWDPDLYPTTRYVPRDQLIIRHLGSFYGPRTPEPLVRALKQVYQRHADLTERVRLELIGHVDARAMALLRELPVGLVSVLPSVPHRASLRLMSDTGLLLVVDAPARSSVFLPSKLIDYVGAERPIVAFSPPGPTADLVRNLGGWVADPDDVDACVAALEEGCARARRFEGSPEYAAIRDAHSSSMIGEQFEALLTGLGLQ